MNLSLKATVYTGTPVKHAEKTPCVSHTLGVEIGSICCALVCLDKEIYRRLGGLYRNFLTEQKPDITIELEKNNRTLPLSEEDVPEPAFRILSDQPDVFIVEMEWQPAESDAGFRYINRLFYLAYYTACLEKYGGDPPAMLVHACGVLRSGRAIVFAGPSDSGKTTIAGMCSEKDGRVISDEMVMLSRYGQDSGVALVQSVPVIGGFPPGINIAVPLSCILLLKKGSRTRANPIGPAEAYLRLIRQVVTPSYIGQKELRSALATVADFSQELAVSAPVYELEFNMDGAALWKGVAELEETLYGKVTKCP